ncbi:glycosyltransferase [Paenibacillus koleovorans]|uniref:glycosyltransferase n=1 Tax=Paenibacillus koleovorans TaxID=121608 RepID=UPI000FDC20E9|nr:glycosyltransferase [Paenibacillus koleovorans]
MRKKKVAFIVPTLDGGGAERVIVTLLNHLSRDLFDPHLVIINYGGKYEKDVSSDVIVHHLHCSRVRSSFIPLVRTIRAIQPDVVLSTISYLNLALLMIKPLLPKQMKFIIRESNTPSAFLPTMSWPALWKFLFRMFYRQADLIICQSDHMIEDMSASFGLDKGNMLRIYNPVDIQKISKLTASVINPFEGMRGPHIVCAGRLTHQKGFDRIIVKLVEWKKDNPDLKVWILGEGELKASLQEQAKAAGVSDHIEFSGFQDNPYQWLSHADLFILCSRYEGLPNIMLEAIACGCPVLAVENPGGTHEIMQIHNLQGQYVSVLPDSLTFDYRKEPLSSSFMVDQIIKQYEKVLKY